MNPVRTLRNYFFPGEMDRLVRDAHAFPRYTPKTIAFRNFNIRVTDFLSVAYQLKEIFGEQRLKFIAADDQPVIYDCGANVGVVSLYFKSLYPKAVIKAFEPEPSVFSCLKENMERNGAGDVLLDSRAVWVHDDGISFGSEGADGGSVFYPGNQKKVASVRLANLLEREKKIDLLKIDIEGAEADVLRDCRKHLSRVHYLFIEYHSWVNRSQALDEILAILRENNFRYTIHSIGKDILQPFCTKFPAEGMDIQLDIHAVHLGNTP